MDSINSRTQPVEDVRADLAESRVAKVETTAPVAETPKADETPQVQAQKAAPEIDKLRTANKELAQTWTDIVAAEDGTIQESPEVDWSAWERAERGLPPEESTSSAAVCKEMPAVAESVGSPPGEVASKPELSPRDWTPEGYQPPQPDTMRTADVQIHQVGPGVFVDDNWNRVETPNQTMFDMEGNPIAVPPPALTGLPNGWTVDPKNGAILDTQGQPMGSPSQLTPSKLEEVRAQLGDIQLVPKLSEEDVQRLVSGRSIGSIEQLLPPTSNRVGLAMNSELSGLTTQVGSQQTAPEQSSTTPQVEGVGSTEEVTTSPALTEARATTARRDASLAQLAQGPMVVAGQEISQVDGYLAISDASWDRFNAAYSRLPEGSQARIDEEMTVVMSDWVQANGAETFNGAAPEIRQELGWTWQAQAASNYANSTEAVGDPADLVDLGDGARQYIEARTGFIQSGGLAIPAATEQVAPVAAPGATEVPNRAVLRQMTPEEQAAYEAAERQRQLERSLQISPKVANGEPVFDPDSGEILGHWAQEPGGSPSSLEFRPSRPIDAPTGILSGEAVIDPETGELLGNWHQSRPVMADIAYRPGEEPPMPPFGPLEFLPVGWLERMREQPSLRPVEPDPVVAELEGAGAVTTLPQIVNSEISLGQIISAPPEFSNQLPPDPETVSIYDPVTRELIGTRPFNRQEYTLPVEPIEPVASQQGSLRSSEIKINEPTVAPPPGKSMFSSLASRVAAQMDSEASTSAPGGKGLNRAIAPPPGKVIGDAELERPGALASGVSGVATSSLVNSDGETVVSMPASVPKNSGRQIAPPPGKVIGAASSSVPLAAPTGEVKDGVVSMAAAEVSSTASPPAQPAVDLAGVRERFQAYRDAMPPQYGEVGSGENSYTGIIEPTEADRQAYAANFVDPQTGMTLSELTQREQVAQAENERQAALQKIIDDQKAKEEAKARVRLSVEQFRAADYGLSARDQELQSNPNAASALARVRAAQGAIVAFRDAELSAANSESGAYVAPSIDPSLLNNPALFERQDFSYGSGIDATSGVTYTRKYATEAEFIANFVDPETGLTARELIHLEESAREKEQGDRAKEKLKNLNLGSFTSDERAVKIPAEQAFTVIGRDQREALMAQGHAEVGKAFMLNNTRQLILPDEHETGVYFLSSLSLDDLRGLGVVDTANGGLNIDGLYLDGGNAHIGTSRPKGGFLGSILNNIGDILPGGKVGDLMADAVSDTIEFLNKPVLDALEFVGEDRDDLATQAVLHLNASVDTIAHAREHGDHTFDVLVERTAEFGQVDQLASAVGKALMAIPVTAVIGAGITAVSGAMMAGHAQLAGDADADPNQGIVQAAQTYFAVQASSAILGGTTAAADSGSALMSNSAGIGSTAASGAGTITSPSLNQLFTTWAQGAGIPYAGQIATFTTNVLSNAAGQAINSGDFDLDAALMGGALALAGGATTIESGPLRGLNAVQLTQLARAAADGDISQLGSLGTSILANLAQRAPEPRDPRAGLRALENQLEFQAGGGEAGSADPGPTAGAPVADDPAAGGPQSGGGPEEPEAGPRDPRAGLRAIENRIGDQVIQGSDGSWMTVNSETGLVRLERVDDQGRTVVTRFGDDGTFAGQRISSPGGLVLEVNSDSRVLRIETADAGRKGFDEAFAAARAQGAGAFSWNGRTYHTGTADQVSAAVQSFAQQNRAALDELSPHIQAAVLTRAATLVENGYSNHAISIERGVVENQAGFDSSGLGTGLSETLAQGRALQAAFLAESQRELAQLNRHQPPTTGPASPAPAVDSTSSTFVNPDVDFGAASGDMQGTPSQAVVGLANTGSALADAFIDHFNNLGTNMGNAARSTTAEGLGAAAAAAYNRLVDGTSRVIQYVAETPLEQMAADFQDLDRRITQRLIDDPVGALLAVGNAVVPLGDIYEASAAMGGRVLSDEEARAQTVKLLGGVGGVLGAVPGAGLVGRAAGAADDIGDLARVGGNVGRNTPSVPGGPDVPHSPQAVRPGTPDAPSGPVRADGNAPATPARSGSEPGVPDAPPATRADGNAPARTGAEPDLSDAPPTTRAGGSEIDLDLGVNDPPWQDALRGDGSMERRIPASDGGRDWTELKKSDGTVVRERQGAPEADGKGPFMEFETPTEKFRSRTYTEDGQRWRELDVEGSRYRVREGGFEGLAARAREAGSQPIDVPGPQGSQRIQIHGAPTADEIARVRAAVEDLPPSARVYTDDIYLSERLGQTLDPKTGRILDGDSPIGGLSDPKGGKGIVLDRAQLNNVANTRELVYHEIGHNFDRDMGMPSSRPPFGDGTSVHPRGLANAAEDFAETHRVVMEDWKRYRDMTDADWAQEPLAAKKREIVRLHLSRSADNVVPSTPGTGVLDFEL